MKLIQVEGYSKFMSIDFVEGVYCCIFGYLLIILIFFFLNDWDPFSHYKCGNGLGYLIGMGCPVIWSVKLIDIDGYSEFVSYDFIKGVHRCIFGPLL